MTWALKNSNWKNWKNKKNQMMKNITENESTQKENYFFLTFTIYDTIGAKRTFSAPTASSQ